MSLDLYVKTKNPILSSGTGVFVRENGRTFELKTVEDVRSRFPDADLSNISVDTGETFGFFHINLTHNLTEMASHIPCGNHSAYELLWHPERMWGECDTKKYIEEWNYTEEGWKLRPEWVSMLEDAMKYALKHEKELSAYNPDNGWGSYEQFRDALCELFAKVYPIEDYDNYYIVASV